MKFIYMVILFSSVLFGMQKQIILGSYSIEKNALDAVIGVEKRIKEDENLKMMLDRSSVNVMPTVISGYTVVSVNIFHSYEELFPSVKALQKYYPDAYVLKYSKRGLRFNESLKKALKKAQNEMLLKEHDSSNKLAKVVKDSEFEKAQKTSLEKEQAIAEGMQRKKMQAEQEILQEAQKEMSSKEEKLEKNIQSKTIESTQKMQELKEATIAQKEDITEDLIDNTSDKKLKEEMKEAAEESQTMEVISSNVDESTENTEDVVEDAGFDKSNYYLLGGLALLILFIGGFIISRKIFK